MDELKTYKCTICKQVKSEENFYKVSATGIVKNKQCKDCKHKYSVIYYEKIKDRVSIYHKEWHKKNKERHAQNATRWNKANPRKVRNYRFKREYGITHDDYDAILKYKSGCCICGKQETAKDNFGKVKMLSIDHCHKTNQVRGILCSACNLTLGSSSENITCLFNMIIYLTQNTIMQNIKFIFDL